MNVKRYFAKTAREALRDLKTELGADAIVLSNRAVQDGVEILALPAEAVGAIEASARPAAKPSPAAPSPARADAARPASRQAAIPNAGASRSASMGLVLDDEGDDDDYTISLSSARRDPGAARQVAGRDGRGASQNVRPFTPPRIDSSRTSSAVAMADVSLRQEGGAGARADGSRMNGSAGFGRQVADDMPDGADMDFIMPPRRSTSAYAEIDGLDSFAAEARPAVRPARAVEAVTPSPRPSERPSESPIEMTQPSQPFGADDERIRMLQETNAQLMNELGSIRGMIERQLAGFAWGETRRNAPARAQIVGELLEAGFSGRLARELAESVDEQASIEEAHDQVRAALARDLRAMSSDADLIDQGGVYALVGPTGVGKTTTTAKIAARCVVRHGAEKLALITTDGYRIGAQEQLRIYGRILGVPVFPVRDAADLRQTLAELRGKHMVLIDTVGMSQRDRMVAQQAAMLMGAGNVRRLLLLNATSRGDTLDDVIQAYRGPDLAGCVLTKIDEAASLAPAIGAAISHQLDVFYVTNGQRVPEDLHLPNRSYLMHRAMKARPEDSPWRMQTDEAALMMAAGGMER